MRSSPPPRRPRRRKSGPPAPSDGLEELKGLPLFAAVVAHELRNPLSAVKIALQTLERQDTIPAKDSARLKIALREVGTIERVLTDVLDWARPPELHPELTSPRHILDLLQSRLGREVEESGVNLDVDLPTSTDELTVDPARIADALLELVRNALDASPRGSTVRISTSIDDQEALFTVTDEGGGITDEDAARAFDPFFARRARGIGLGLPRAKDVAVQHGGDVTLESRLAGGARATVRLPRTRR